MDHNSTYLPAAPGYRAIFDALDAEGVPMMLSPPVVAWLVTEVSAFPVVFGPDRLSPDSAVAVITPAGAVCTLDGANYESMAAYELVYWNQRRDRDPVAPGQDGWLTAKKAADAPDGKPRDLADKTETREA